MAAGPKLAAGFLTVFALPFLAGGVGALAVGVRSFLTGDWHRGGFLVIFGLAFGVSGLAVLSLAFYGYPRAQRSEALKAAHPGAPWLWREDWGAGRVDSPAGASAVSTWFFAVLWNLISAPLFVVVPREVSDKGNTLALIGLLFPAIGIGLLVWAARQTIRWRKFGSSTLDLAAVPAPLGGRLEGAIHTSALLRPAHGVKLRLSCIHQTRSGTGRDRTTWESALWQDEQAVTERMAPGPGVRSAIPVSFVLPADKPGTNPDNSDDRILWRLEAWAEVPGVDYRVQFEVPVFGIDQSAAPAATAPQAPSRPPHPTIAMRPTSSGGYEFIFPPARNLSAGLSVTIFTAIWGGFTWLLAAVGAPLFFFVIFAAFGILLFGLTLFTWLGTSRVLIERGMVTVASGLPGLMRTRQVPCREVAGTRLDIGMQAGGTAYWDIKLLGPGGSGLTAGQSIRDKREAEWVAGEMEKRIRESAR